MNIFTEAKEGLKISWSAIRANKMRSVLTTLGIVIGIVTVTLMGTAIEGLNRSFMQSISVIGADVLFVQRFNWVNFSHEDWMKMMKRREVTLAQATALEKQLTMALAVAPAADTQETVPEPVTEPVAEPVTEPVAEDAEPEPDPAPPAEPEKPRVVTRTRRRSASRPAGPPASAEDPNGSGAGDAVADSPTEPTADEAPALHVPVKRKGARKR